MKENIDLNQMILALHCKDNSLLAEELDLPSEVCQIMVDHKMEKIRSMLNYNKEMSGIFKQLKDFTDLDTLDNLELLLDYLKTNLGPELASVMVRHIQIYFKDDIQTAEILTERLSC